MQYRFNFLSFISQAVSKAQINQRRDHCSRWFKSADCVLLALFLGHVIPLGQSTLWPLWPLIALVFSCVFLLLLTRVKAQYVVFMLALCLGLLSATLRFQSQLDRNLPPDWERKDITLIAKVNGLPKQRGRDVTFTATVLAQQQSSSLQRLIGQRVQLSCYRCPFTIEPGQTWEFTARFKQPHGYASPGAFDYEKYLFRHRLLAKGYLRLKSPNLLINDSAANIDLWRLNIKKRLVSTLEKSGQTFTRSEPGKIDGAGINTIIALSIGDKSGFTQAQREVLQKTGLSHLFAISGLHIGIIFIALLWLSKWCWNIFPRVFEHCPRPYLCLPIALLGAVVYSALSGFSVSTQRALLMLLVFAAMRLLTKEVALLKGLLFAAVMLLIYDPFAILDTGFWLSCSAVAVIALVVTQRSNTNLLTLQPALWLGLMPLSVVLFGQISLVSPLLNLVAVPLFSLVLIPLTLISIGLNELGLQALAGYLLAMLECCYRWVFKGLDWLVEQRFISLNLPDLVWWQYGLMLAMAISYLFRQRRLSLIWPVLFISGFLLSVLLSLTHKREEQELLVTLLDVGQGLSMVVQTPSAVTVYDTGPRYSSGFTAAQAVLLPYLRTKGIKHIDRLIISHADNDHIGGYQAVRDAVTVGEVLTSRVDKLPNATACWAGQQWHEGATQFTILSPEPDTPTGSNNRSCVLRLEHHGTSVLISGDIEKQVERFLLKQDIALNADILLVPHQGSKTSSTAAFIDAVAPRLALVAAGYKNHYGHPHPSVSQRYRERNIPMWSTVTSGTIEIAIDQYGFDWQRYRQVNRRFWHWQTM